MEQVVLILIKGGNCCALRYDRKEKTGTWRNRRGALYIGN